MQLLPVLARHPQTQRTGECMSHLVYRRPLDFDEDVLYHVAVSAKLQYPPVETRLM